MNAEQASPLLEQGATVPGDGDGRTGLVWPSAAESTQMPGVAGLPLRMSRPKNVNITMKDFSASSMREVPREWNSGQKAVDIAVGVKVESHNYEDTEAIVVGRPQARLRCCAQVVGARIDHGESRWS